MGGCFCLPPTCPVLMRGISDTSFHLKPQSHQRALLRGLPRVRSSLGILMASVGSPHLSITSVHLLDLLFLITEVRP